MFIVQLKEAYILFTGFEFSHAPTDFLKSIESNQCK